MNHQQKFVRFQDWKSDKSFDGLSPSKSGAQPGRFRSVLYSVSDKFQRGLESGSDQVKRFTRSIRFCSLKKFLADDEVSRNKILNPQGSFLQKWNKIFVLSCVIAVSLDPLFFYIPIVDDEKKCLDLDHKLEVTASILRSFTDLFYLSHIVFQFRTGFIAPSSRVFGRGVLIEDSWEIAKRYLSSYFIIDILAVLPLPQVKNFHEHTISWLLSCLLQLGLNYTFLVNLFCQETVPCELFKTSEEDAHLSNFLTNII